MRSTMVYQQINDNSFSKKVFHDFPKALFVKIFFFFILEKDMFRGENIMLSTSTSNSSFLNANATGDFATDTDDRIQILDCENTRPYQEPMTQTRIICFIASIVGTVLVVIVFLLLPCESNCVANTGFMKTRNWIQTYEKMEFKGDVNTIMQPDGSHPRNLVLLYRSDKIFPDLSTNKKNKQKSSGGVLTLAGNSGEIAWTREMSNEPRAIDCNLIDCDKSGTKDCLILDSVGQLSCLDGSGHLIYYILNPKATKPTRKDLLDFPLMLPDLDGDKVNEVMMGSSNGKSNSTDLIIFSGANGKLLTKEPYNCSFLHKLQIDKNYVVKFICMLKEDKEQQMFRNLTDLYSKMSKKPLDLKKLEPAKKIVQHKFYGQRSSTSSQTTLTNIQDKQLDIANKGAWPRESKVSIKLTSKVYNVTKTLYEYEAGKVYAMVPTSFSLNSSANGRKNDNIHGFVIKFWIWNGTEINYNLDKTRFKRSAHANRFRRSPEKRDLKAQRSNYTNQTFTGSSVYKTKLFYLKESIMLIVFNGTNMKVENASQSNIVQFCQRTNSKDKTAEKRSDSDSICQPDLNYQENSILITDIDGDGSKELVSYYSTFINENNSGDVTADRWKLKTFIQLFKLETELPKLYVDIY